MGEDLLGIVFFPGAWTTTQPRFGEPSGAKNRYLLNYPDGFRLRKSRATSAAELFLGVESLGASSDDHFAVSVDGRFAVRALSQREWDDGSERTRPAQSAIDSVEAAAFHGSGERLGPVLRSPTQRLVAVMSYSGVGPKSQGNWIGRGDWRGGTMYLDVFDQSGRKVAAGSSRYSGGESASALFNLAEWVDDGVLIVPLDGLAQTCFLAILE